MRKIFNKLRSMPKRYAVLTAALLAAVIVPAALNAWGPSDRATFTWDKPATYITYNSMTNNPKQGDERDFFKIRDYTNNGQFTEKLDLVPGREYEITAYYHNNASTTLNDANSNYAGVAKGAYMRVEMPEVIKTGQTGRMNAFIGASNAEPAQVWDEVYGNNKTAGDITLRYVPNSATIRNNGALNGSKIDLNKLAGANGTLLGYNSLDGVLNGCEQYSGFVTYRIVADQPNFELYKQVRKADTGTWGENVNVTAKDEVEFRIEYRNTGTVKQDPVTINDKLPAGLTYVAGSSVFANSTTGGQWEAVGHDDVVKNGINVGGYLPKGNVFVKFKAKVDEKALKCGKNELVNNAFANTNNGTKRDTATVTINKECAPEPEAIVTCDALTVTKLERTKFKFDTKYTIENATLKHITYVVKDANGKEVYRGTNKEFATNTVGKYTVQSYVTATVKNSDKTVTSEGCKKEFEVVKEKTPAIKIEKTVNDKEHDKVEVGKPFTYQVKVTNTGEVDLKDAKVTDKAPTNVKFISADKGTITDNQWSYTISSLKVGQSETFNIKAEVTKEVEGNIKNTACVDTPTIPGSPDDCDDATVEVPKTPTPPVTPPTTPTTPTTPTELPRTGVSDVIASIVGLGALIGSASYYIISRRALG